MGGSRWPTVTVYATLDRAGFTGVSSAEVARSRRLHPLALDTAIAPVLQRDVPELQAEPRAN
ncbi:hypothetical protein [Micromonospora sp. IBSANI012]|uniref:hypothetical protein n=1 Tax=Micromonospora sp. IBSANI012 TaxID=3457761 RepID=UPI00405872A6